MNLSQLTAKPVLIQIILDDEATIKEYGESVDFWTWDRQPMDVFMKLASSDGATSSKIIDIVKTLVLDEKGREILVDDVMLPTSILMKAIGKITDMLGK
jgi:hypothetical protein